MRNVFILIAICFLFTTQSIGQVVVGPYTGTTHLTNITGPCSAAALSVLGDTDFTDGSYEIAFGSVFEGTWASGLGYVDGPGDEILCVSLHTEESWTVRLRLSDGSYSNGLLADMTPTVDNNALNLYDCGAGALNPGWNYDRRVALLDFANFTIPAGLTVVGAEFTLETDNAGYADPVGMLLMSNASIPTISNNGPLCAGDTLILDIQNPPANGTFSWSGPNGFTSSQQTVTIPNFTAVNAGVYSCVVTDTVGVDQVFNLNTTVVINPQPAIFSDTTACNQTFTVQGTIAASGGVWSAVDPAIQFNSTTVLNPIISAVSPGIYTVDFTDNPCGVTVSAEITFPAPAYTAVSDTTICSDTEYTITALQQAGNSYSWNTGATGPSITVTQAGNYIVTATNVCDSYSDTATIFAIACDIEVPNIISLSSQNGNNLFFVDYSGIKSFECTIINRWGNEVFHYNDPAMAWDGKNQTGELVDEGTYFYTIKAVLSNDEELVKQGFVQVYH
ncbi:MAG: gliding motility-associated C-terminal domain-containing protein [Flavobacteriia bacterium]|nr:gliding motility-associated C-terminal domain-containing protein [Flavobacteriia bacterium]